MTARLAVTVRKLIGLAGAVSLLLVVRATPTRAQAVELFAGDDAATVDVMFFNYFKDAARQPSPVLLFHRSRVLVDYDIDSSSRRHLPQFGMTNAVSYNPEALRGLRAGGGLVHHHEHRVGGAPSVSAVVPQRK